MAEFWLRPWPEGLIVVMSLMLALIMALILA